MPRVGDSLALFVQLGTGDTDKFPQATVKDSNNVQIAQVALVHQGNGMYTNNTVLFPPHRPWVLARYQIFDNSGFTVPSEGFPETADRFELTVSRSATASNFTPAMLCSLEAAIAQGAMKVKYSDKEVTYRSLDEMLRVRDLMRKELGIVGSKNLRILPSFSKGF